MKAVKVEEKASVDGESRRPPRVPLWDCAATALGMAYNGPWAMERLENRYGPAFVMGAGGGDFYHLSGQDVLELLRRKDSGEILHEPASYRRAFSKTLDGASIANSLEGVDHSRARSAINRGTHSLSGAEHIGSIAKLTNQRLGDIAQGAMSGLPAIRIFGDIATRQVAAFLGMRLTDEHIADVRTLSRAMVRAAVFPGGGAMVKLPSVRRAKERLRALGVDFITSVREGSVAEPIILGDTKRAALKYPELFSEEDQVWHLLTPIIGAAETLPGSMLTLFWHVWADPALVCELRAECKAAGEPPADGRALFDFYSRPLLDGCVEEGLRIAPVTWLLRREAVREFDYAGFTVPKGANVTLNSTRAHFDQEVFADPYRFDPRRPELRTHAVQLSPFGTGTHICPGISLSKLLMKIALVEAIGSFDFAFTESAVAAAKGRMSFTGEHSFARVEVCCR